MKIIGGGISAQDILIEYIQKNVGKYCGNFRNGDPNFYVPKPKVARCKFRNDANLIGVLYNFIVHYTAKPKEVNLC